MNKVLEFNGATEKNAYPIVKFPPLDLRAWLIEKDPVVWAHLLETYVEFFEYLMQQDHIEHINDTTYDQLCMFVRNYLHEMSEEKSQIISLGENHDVVNNMALLRNWIYFMIKRCGILYLQLFGNSLWDMVRLYVENNPDSVRGLLDGSLKPKINTQKAQLNRIHQIQQNLKHSVESGKFQRVDIRSLELLLTAKGKKSNNHVKFADEFLTATWIEVLESWWSKGKGRLQNEAKQLALVTLLAASSSKIATLLKELGISNLDTLSLYPLLGTLLINEKFQSRKSDLNNHIAFLNLLDGDVEESDDDNILEEGSVDTVDAVEPVFEVKEEDIKTLLEFFPDITHYQASQLLQRYDSNVELVSNTMFENPSVIDDIPKEKPQKTVRPKKKVEGKVSGPKKDQSKAKVPEIRLSRMAHKGKKPFDNSITKKHVPDEVKNKTMERALKLIYESDEDEPDDTYDEAEVGRTNLNEKDNKKSNNNDDEGYDSDVKEKQKETANLYDEIEGFLWNLLKEDPKVFKREQRGTKGRKNIKQQISWSDEQIEGWARMLERSPKRAMLLEEKYMFRGNKKSGKKAFVQNRDGNTKEHDFDKGKNGRMRKKPEAPKKEETDNNASKKSAEQIKRDQAKNQKNKSSKANHNRKKQRDKKVAKVAGP